MDNNFSKDSKSMALKHQEESSNRNYFPKNLSYTRKSTAAAVMTKNSSRLQYSYNNNKIDDTSMPLSSSSKLKEEEPFQRASSISGRLQAQNINTSTTNNNINNNQPLNNSQIINSLKASTLSSRNNIQRSAVNHSSTTPSNNLNSNSQGITQGSVSVLQHTNTTSSFVRQSRNTDPLLSPMGEQPGKKQQVQQQFSTQDNKRAAQYGLNQQVTDNNNTKDFSKLPPQNNNSLWRKESRGSRHQNNNNNNQSNDDSGNKRNSSRLSQSRTNKTDSSIDNRNALFERARNQERPSNLFSAPTDEKIKDHRLSVGNELPSPPLLVNQVLTPQNQTQPLVPSTGGSYDHKLQLRQNSENRQVIGAGALAQRNQLYFSNQEKAQVNPLKNFDEAKFSSKSHGLIVSYAANTHQGIQRNYNEDRVSIILNMTRPASKKNLAVWPKCSFFAIYDGHGGSQCADFLKEYLHQIIINQDCFPANPAQALTNGCLAAEAQFLQIADQVGRHDKSGSCAIIVLIVEQNCYVANVGDSRAIMSAEAGQKLFVLSRDHRPNEDQEKLRITENGGKIYQTQTFQTISPQNSNNPSLFGSQQLLLGPYRVLPGRLSVSRTFGDIEAKLEKFGGKNGVVIAQPEIAQFTIQEDLHDFIILGCDGIFDRLNNLQLQDCAWKTIEQHKNPGQNLSIHQVCGKVVDQILQLSAIEKSFDNLTLVMIAFRNVENYFTKKQGEGQNTKNIKILEEETQLQFMPNQGLHQNLTPQQKNNQDRNKKILLDKLISSKRGDQKLSSRGRSYNPFEADSSPQRPGDSFTKDSSALPILKHSTQKPQPLGLQNSLATIQSRKSTRNKFLSTNSNTNYLAQQQQILNQQQQSQVEQVNQSSSPINNSSTTANQILNSRNRALASFYNSEKLNLQQPPANSDLQNMFRKSRQGGLAQNMQLSRNNQTQIEQQRPKSNSRIGNSKLALETQNSIVSTYTASNYHQNTSQQDNSVSTPSKYGSFQYPQNKPVNQPSPLFSSGLTPKQNFNMNLKAASGSGGGNSSIIGSLVGSGLVTMKSSSSNNNAGQVAVSEFRTSQTVGEKTSIISKNSIISPDKKKNLPSLKGPRANIEESISNMKSQGKAIIRKPQ